MEKFSASLIESLGDSNLDMSQIRKAAAFAWVKNLWRALVEEDIANHTNRVYLTEEDGIRKLQVYVDDSIYASELNARRELIRLQCAQEFGHVIDVFDIHISRGKWKGEHPFAKTEPQSPAPEPQPLSSEELKTVEETCQNIEDPALRDKFKEAMIADLEWMKGNS